MSKKSGGRRLQRFLWDGPGKLGGGKENRYSGTGFYTRNTQNVDATIEAKWAGQTVSVSSLGGSKKIR